MRRYFFDRSENGRYFPDREGVDCVDETDARAVAQAKVRREVRRRIREGCMPTGGFVTIRLGCGERLAFLSYQEALGAA